MTILYFFFQAEDGIRAADVTGVQTCALPILARALKRELPVRAHAHRADDIMTALRIAKEFNLDISIEHCTEGHKIVNELKEAGVWAIVGPTLSNRSKVELKELSFNTLKTLYDAGIPVAITMDHPVVPVGYMPTVAAHAVKAGLPYEEALKAITINPAKILGIDAEYGSIEQGKMADLVLWSGDPLDVQSRVEKVFIHGQIVHEA